MAAIYSTFFVGLRCAQLWMFNKYKNIMLASLLPKKQVEPKIFRFAIFFSSTDGQLGCLLIYKRELIFFCILYILIFWVRNKKNLNKVVLKPVFV